MAKAIQFDHIACGVRRLVDCYPFVLRLGGRPRKGGNDPAFSGGQWKFSNNSCLELIEPNFQTQDNFLHRFISKSGPGIHHITFIVPSLENALKKAKSLGLTVVGISDKKKHWKEAFLHPKDSLNILTQLAEWNPEEKEDGVGWVPEWSGFNEFNRLLSEQQRRSPGSDESIIGLRGLRVAINRDNLQKADSIFGTLLEGKMIQSTENSLTYTWEGSTMVLQVEVIEPSAAAGIEGVIGIEYFSKAENHDRDILNPPYDALVGAKFFPMKLANNPSRL